MNFLYKEIIDGLCIKKRENMFFVKICTGQYISLSPKQSTIEIKLTKQNLYL